MAGQYSIDTLDESTFVIKAESGDVVEQDANNQAFCDYLTWASRNTENIPQALRPLKPDTYYYSDANRLIAHFKKWDGSIHTAPTGTPGGRRLLTGEKRSIGGTHFFTVLEKSVPEGGDDDGGQYAHDGLTAVESSVWVTDGLLKEFVNHLWETKSEHRRITSWPIERTFVYLDVSDYSRQPPGHQLLIVRSIVNMVEDERIWAAGWPREARENLESQICIGDGYIFVFTDAAFATIFAAYLAHALEVHAAKKRLLVEFHFRMGVHTGDVFTFWDPGRKDWNYVGDGINGGQRVLGAIGKDTDDVLFISSRVRQIISANPSRVLNQHILKHLHNRGRRADKHGNHWRVYEVAHTSMMSNFGPP